ncbi:polyhydroxybutyrate depolymerase [Phaeobacter sp. JL2872]|nr:polyhydroxybutyrate depolymerase [Phaeobacter sp. JL2872]
MDRGQPAGGAVAGLGPARRRRSLRLRRAGGTLLSLFVAALCARPALASCGAAAEACDLPSGDYHIATPDPGSSDSAEAKGTPAVVFLHGYGGSGAGVLRNRALVKGLQERGYALIAPTALPRWNGKRSWNFLPGAEGRDEAQFLQQVLGDAESRFGIDRQRVVLAGFSAGAFMVNYLACAHPGDFAAFAPVAGGFWRPRPETCAGPVRLLHTHGWADKVVPLEGRILGSSTREQDDIFAGLALWRQVNGCADDAPDRLWVTGAELHRRWDCQSGGDIELTLGPGGHRIPDTWPTRVVEWFERTPD